MSTEKPIGDDILIYLKMAKFCLQKAEETHGQPLYYDKDGNYIDLGAEIDRQIAIATEYYPNSGKYS